MLKYFYVILVVFTVLAGFQTFAQIDKKTQLEQQKKENLAKIKVGDARRKKIPNFNFFLCPSIQLCLQLH